MRLFQQLILRGFQFFLWGNQQFAISPASFRLPGLSWRGGTLPTALRGRARPVRERVCTSPALRSANTRPIRGAAPYPGWGRRPLHPVRLALATKSDRRRVERSPRLDRFPRRLKQPAGKEQKPRRERCRAKNARPENLFVFFAAPASPLSPGSHPRKAKMHFAGQERPGFGLAGTPGLARLRRRRQARPKNARGGGSLGSLPFLRRSQF